MAWHVSRNKPLFPTSESHGEWWASMKPRTSEKPHIGYGWNEAWYVGICLCAKLPASCSEGFELRANMKPVLMCSCDTGFSDFLLRPVATRHLSADPPVGGVSEIPKVFLLDAFLHFFTPLESLERSAMLGAPLHLLTPLESLDRPPNACPHRPHTQTPSAYTRVTAPTASPPKPSPLHSLL